jgi:hypothetical protein
MPRRKAANTSVATPRPAKSTHKRQLSTNSTPATSATRASKRIKDSANNTPASATPRKSKYFEEADSQDEESEVSSDNADASGYEDGDASEDASPTSEEESDEYDSSEDIRPKRPKGRKVAASAPENDSRGSQLWREGVKAGLGPGKQVFIAKPKPRGDAGIKYTPELIHPNTMLFLKDLKANNDREWLKSMYLDNAAVTRANDCQCTTPTTDRLGRTGRVSLKHLPRRSLRSTRRCLNCLQKTW